MVFKVKYSERIETSGNYPFAEMYKKVSALRARGVDVIDFGVGDPKSPTPDFVIDALSVCARMRATSGYPSYNGDISYRSSCAKYLSDNFGVALNPETQISSTLGAKESVFNFPLAFVNPDDYVICPTPGYPVYATGTKFAGGKVYNVPLLPENDFLIDFEAIPDEIADKARIIWTNYPNSPTGKSAPLGWLEKLVKWADIHNIIIAADEGCYIDIYYNEKPHSILEVTNEGVIAFYSSSKRNNMTGYRVGFVAGDENIVEGFKKVKTNIDSGTPTFIQDVAALALRDSNHIAKMRSEYKAKYAVMSQALIDAGLPRCPSESTFYIWQKAPEGMSGACFADMLVEQGIVVTPGSYISNVCNNGLNPGENYVRIALVPNLDEVKEAARRIKNMDFNKSI